MRRFPWRDWVVSGALLCGACTNTVPRVVASNCDKADHCAKQEALHIDSVDILLVVDDSASLALRAEALKAQLPRLLTAVTTGGDGNESFPPVNSVHVAVTTTDMDIGNDSLEGCRAGDIHDGKFIRPADVGVTCETSYPGYLAFEGGPAPIATLDSVACVPLVFSEDGDSSGAGRRFGCGFEQPLEAALKALWPTNDNRVSFLMGQGHGSTDNAGFLRDNSLLVVVVVTDEDDCSAENQEVFLTDSMSTTTLGPLNTRCGDHPNDLYAVQRYITNLQQLRPDNDNVIFALIAGLPTDLVSDDFRAHYDLSKPEDADAYYNDVLADQRMQLVTVVPPEIPEAAYYAPSCTTLLPGPPNSFPNPVEYGARPPRRLVQVAQGFKSNSVLGSICNSDFGSTTGSIIHAIGQKLVNAGAK
jgi:hypothetical protein